MHWQGNLLRPLLRFLRRHPATTTLAGRPANVRRQTDFRHHVPVQSIPASGLRAENLLGSRELTEVLSPPPERPFGWAGNCPILIRMYTLVILSTDFFASEQVTSPIHPVFFLFLKTRASIDQYSEANTRASLRARSFRTVFQEFQVEKRRSSFLQDLPRQTGGSGSSL